MDKKLLLLIVIVGVFTLSSQVHAANETNTTNVTNITEPVTSVGCSGMCSYFWGIVLNTTWVPNIISITGLGNCSLMHVETASLMDDRYEFKCVIPYLNLTETQEFIFLLMGTQTDEIKELNDDITVLTNNVSATMVQKIQAEGVNVILIVVIVFMSLFIGYMIYETQF